MLKWTVLSTLLLGCTGAISGPENRERPGRDAGVEEEDPTQGSRTMRRLSADQLVRSLEVVTGQRWEDYERFASSLGKPDLVNITAEARDIGVSFEKLAGDGARATCKAAISADLELTDSESRAILRYADASTRDRATLSRNLKYLYLRFHSVYIEDDSDSRLAPGLELWKKGNPSKTKPCNFDGKRFALAWRLTLTF